MNEDSFLGLRFSVKSKAQVLSQIIFFSKSTPALSFELELFTGIHNLESKTTYLCEFGTISTTSAVTGGADYQSGPSSEVIARSPFLCEFSGQFISYMIQCRIDSKFL